MPRKKKKEPGMEKLLTPKCFDLTDSPKHMMNFEEGMKRAVRRGGRAARPVRRRR